jgi:hypothetical protein
MKYIEFNRPEEAVLADLELRDSQMSDHKSVTILVSPWEFSHFWEQKARSSETLIVVKDWRETFIEVDSESL